MTKRKHEEIRNAVRENYGKVAQEGTTGCCCSTSSCCGKPGEVSLTDISLGLGYSSKDVADIPDGSNMAEKQCSTSAAAEDLTVSLRHVP